jgi:hypothetical protein
MPSPISRPPAPFYFPVQELMGSGKQPTPAFTSPPAPYILTLKSAWIGHLLGTKSHSLTRSLWLSSILTRSESAGAPCLYHGGKEH